MTNEANRRNGELGHDDLQLASPFTIIIPRSLLTHNVAISSAPATSSVLSKMPPWMIPFMHSYNNDIAGVVRIMFVRGGSNFRTRRGSRGVKVANCARISQTQVAHKG